MPPSGLSLLTAALVALLVSAPATWAVARLAPGLGLVDRSNPRSSHSGEVARGGGLALLLGTAAGLLAAGVGTAADPMVLVPAWGALAVAGVGLVDDRQRLSPLARLAVHAAAAAAVVAVAGGVERLPLPPPLDLPVGALSGALAVVWIVAVVNFYNFLDGIDGLAGLQAVVTGAAVALAEWHPFAALTGAGLAGASAGFLFHNWSPARVFMGDVGSGFLGFSLAAAPFLAPPSARPAAIGLVGLSLFLFLGDATWTLAVRLARGARVHQAHREHLYQRIVLGGWTHARTTAALVLASLAVTVAALAGWRSGRPALTWAALGLAAAAFAAEAALAHRAGGGAARLPAGDPR